MKKSEFNYTQLNEDERAEEQETQKPPKPHQVGNAQMGSASDSSPVKRDIRNIIDTFGENIDSDRDAVNISITNDDTMTTVSSVNIQMTQHGKSTENKPRNVQFIESAKSSDKESVSTISTTKTTCEICDSIIDISLLEHTEYNNRHIWNYSTYLCHECQDKFYQFICKEFQNKGKEHSSKDTPQITARSQPLAGLVPKQQVVYNNYQLLQPKSSEPSSFDVKKKQVVFVDPIYKRHKYYEFREHSYVENQNCQDYTRYRKHSFNL